MDQPAIQIQNLGKVFKGELGEKDFTALSGLDLDVYRGEIFAFLGPNGAGKTTTIKLINRLIFPTKGTIFIDGVANTSPAAMTPVGYLPEQPHFYGYLSGREFLDFMGRLSGLNRATRNRRIPELVERVGLTGRDTDAIRGYSRGMVQRLGLAQALIHDPSILILDEPMANLDPVGRRDFRHLILELKEEGKTLFFSSHILADAEMIADRVAILNRGHLQSSGRLDDMLKSPVEAVDVLFEGPGKEGRDLDWKTPGRVLGECRRLITLDDESQTATLLKRIDQWGGRVISVSPQRKSLESLFMEEVDGGNSIE